MYTYKQTYDKIIDAYFKDEIKPYDQEFCFCGTLCNNEGDWFNYMKRNESFNDYTPYQLRTMERALLIPLARLVKAGSDYYILNLEISREDVIHHKNYEDTLFEGMCAVLEVLKQIHIERGEKIEDDNYGFKKRELIKE